MSSLDKPCPHENFHAHCDVNRLTDNDETTVIGFSADLRIWCTDCDEKFRFNAPMGDSPSEPRMSVDGTELRCPIRPASSDDDFGLGLPEYSVEMKQVGEIVSVDPYPVPPLDPNDHGVIDMRRYR